ncbi:phosphotransferase family protein [Mycobacterium palustre]|uniref:phosphotransferase family protein n=1 Tax=Mycobacterium palustre TaxID=153971 RepID=UPI00318367C4
MTAHAVGDGHSNLTYVVSDGERQVVVRRPPTPPFPVGAHDVLREARLIAALAGTGVPVPAVLAIADAGTIIDVPLVVTEFVDGVVITTTAPKPFDRPAARRDIAERAVDTLADLHTVDWKAHGLNDFGRPAGFNARHLRRVCALVTGTRDRMPEPFVSLARWLERNVPVESGATIVHNDYRLGNLMYAREPPVRIAAVLDWELATLGDPLFDLGYFLSSIPEADEPGTAITRMATVALQEGFPTRAELLDRYCARTGTTTARTQWYAVLAQFKLAALYDYGRRRAEESGGDSYFAEAELVSEFLGAGEALTKSR